MSVPLRLLFTRKTSTPNPGPGFDLAQAAAALDVPLQLGFAGPAIEAIVPRALDTTVSAGSGPWASLSLLGVEHVYAAAADRAGLDDTRAALPVIWLDATQWQEWLRCAPLQGW